MPANDFAKLLTQLNADLRWFEQCVQAIQEYQPTQGSSEWLHQAQNFAKLMQAGANKAQVIDYYRSSTRLLRTLDKLVQLRLNATNRKLVNLVLSRLSNQLNGIFSDMSWRVPLQPKLFLLANWQPLTIEAVAELLEQPNRMFLNLLDEMNQLRQCSDAQGRPLPFNGIVDLQGRRDVIARFTGRLLTLLRRIDFQESTLQMLESSILGRLPKMVLSLMGKLKFSSATLLLSLRQFQSAHALFKQLINNTLAATVGVKQRYLVAHTINEASEQFVSILLDQTLHQLELYLHHQQNPALLREKLSTWENLQQTHQAKNLPKAEYINNMHTQIRFWFASELQAMRNPEKLWQLVRDFSGVLSTRFAEVADMPMWHRMAAVAGLTLSKDAQLANTLGPVPLPQLKSQPQSTEEMAMQMAFMVLYVVLTAGLQYWILQTASPIDQIEPCNLSNFWTQSEAASHKDAEPSQTLPVLAF